MQSEIEAQTVQLRAKNLTLRVMGQTELSTELKDKATLVRDFFGREWVRDFAEGGEDADQSLDVADIATTRAELQKLYLSNFSGIDPGIVAANAGRVDSSRLLPILDRFVEPDVEIADTGEPMEGPSPPAERLRPRRVTLRRALLRLVAPRRSRAKCYAAKCRGGWRKTIIP